MIANTGKTNKSTILVMPYSRTGKAINQGGMLSYNFKIIL